MQRALRSTAFEAADAARAESLRYFRTDLSADNKSADDFDPVTEGDRAAEKAIRAVLAARRPDDAILGEEFGFKEGTSGLNWVLDPIDGTRGYLSGTPTWGTLISVGDASGPIAGLIDQPFIGERFWGGFGQADYVGPHGGGPLKTSSRTLAEARLFTTFPEMGRDQDRAGFEAVAPKARLVRYGMDCYGYALVAAGTADLVIEAGLQSYDIHAPIAVVEAAGGRLTNWSGGPVHEGGQAVAAANDDLHAEALALLAPFADD